MGEYAEYALRDAMRGGLRWPDKPREKRPPSHVCPDCQKPIIGWMGLTHHAKVKHGRKMTFSDTVAHQVKP